MNKQVTLGKGTIGSAALRQKGLSRENGVNGVTKISDRLQVVENGAGDRGRTGDVQLGKLHVD